MGQTSNLGRVEPINWIRPKSILINRLPNKAEHTLSYKISISVLNNRLPNNTQITTNNISGLLCRSRPLRFIEDQLSLKNRIVKNTSRKITRSFGYIYKRHSEARKNPYKKTRERREKHGVNLGRNQAQKTPRPSYEDEKITIINENIYIIYIDKFIERRSIELSPIFEINQLI